jgi:uncharacterized membrane protein YkoI
MMSFHRTSHFMLLFLGLSAPVLVAHADDGRSPEDEPPVLSNDELARQVREGKILPLTALKERVLAELRGELIDVSVERERGRILYEFKVLRPGGEVSEVELDAATGEIIKIENE